MGFPASTVMEASPLQSLKGKSGPIEVTKSGMVIEVSPLQPEKASPSIVLME